MSRDEVEVCADLEGFGEPTAMGWLRRQRARSGDVLSFEYAPSWLERADVFAFDPDLALVRGRQSPSGVGASEKLRVILCYVAQREPASDVVKPSTS